LKMHKIGTHNGTFHCDEVLACFFLRQLPEYSVGAARCRLIETCLGLLLTPRCAFNFFNVITKPWLTKLSSAGLVYLHFGRRVLSQLAQLKEDDRQLEVLYDKLYENFVEEVDAVDNGISQCDGEARYSISTTLSARVSHLNPRWNSTDQDTEEGFKKALKMVGEEFLDRLDFYKSSWLPAREVVEEAVKKRHQIDPSGEVLLFSQGGCPWKEHLFALEKDLHVETPIKFVLYPDQNGQWRVQCVPAGLNTFQNR
uniref:MYG1 exonuclease n=1 Tax=Neolamprologus brichardi TaxID=32507 RepID=A0A3Q4GDW8_NEOBR